MDVNTSDEFEYDDLADLADFKNCMVLAHAFYKVQQDEERMDFSGERHKHFCIIWNFHKDFGID